METEEKTKAKLTLKIVKIIRVLLIVYIVMCLGIYFFQSKLVFVPTKGEPQYTPQNLGLDFEDFMLESGSEKINAWFIPSKANKGTVFFCHGNAGNLGHRLSTIRIWHELGMNILLFDYRGFGKRTSGGI